MLGVSGCPLDFGGFPVSSPRIVPRGRGNLWLYHRQGSWLIGEELGSCMALAYLSSDKIIFGQEAEQGHPHHSLTADQNMGVTPCLSATSPAYLGSGF